MGHAGFFAIGGYTAAVISTAGAPSWLSIPRRCCRHRGCCAPCRNPGAAPARALPGHGHPRVRLHRVAHHPWHASFRAGGRNFGHSRLPAPCGARHHGQARAARAELLHRVGPGGRGGPPAGAEPRAFAHRAGRFGPFTATRKPRQPSGIDVARHKLAVFVLSAVYAGLAGACLAHFNGGIGPGEAGIMKSVRYVALVAAGGMGSLWGTLAVSTALTFLSLRGAFGLYDDAVFGGLLVAIMLFAPEGVFGLLRGRRKARRRQRDEPAAPVGPGPPPLVRRPARHQRRELLLPCGHRDQAIIGPNGAGKTTLVQPRRREPLTRRREASSIDGKAIHGAPPSPGGRSWHFTDLPGHAPFPRHERPGERHGGPTPQGSRRVSQRPGRTAFQRRGKSAACAGAAWTSWKALGSRRWQTRKPARCPSGASGWWSSPGRLQPSRGSCSWTSRPAG